MDKVILALVSCCLVAAAAAPVQAFTAKSLTITLAPDGDATLDMQYDLSLIEESAVFFRIADPAAELKNAFDTHSSSPVIVPSATDTSAEVIIPGFADVARSGPETRMTTPGLSFARAQEVMDGYWFAPLVSPDFSPAVTTVIFPDGHRDTYSDALTIPSVNHLLNE